MITLDPPFNSARNYNLLFKQVEGESSPAQIMAFEDTDYGSRNQLGAASVGVSSESGKASITSWI